MSIDSALARVSEIEDRIAQVFPQPALTAISASAASAASPVAPFNVALAQATGATQLQATNSAFSPQIEALISKYSALRGLDPAVVRAVIHAESDGDPNSVSRAGAKGLMQIMPDELRAYGISDAFDPEQNISAGTRQLADKLKLFNGDLKLALAAYNAGSGAVKKYHGIPPYPETRTYVKRILGMLGSE